MQNAIIIGAQNVGFSLVRSLKDKGIRLMVLATDPYDFAQYSRFVQEWRRVPSPATSSKAFMAWLLHSASRWEGALLLPSSDAALLSLCRNRHLILQHYRAALPDLEPLENLIHKGRLYRLAQELHLPVPRFHQPGSLEELRQLRPHLQFPCLLKPCESSLFFANFQCKLFRLETFEELENAWTKAQNHSLETIICELIPGADDHLFFYASYRTEDGTVTGEVCVQKLRQHPPGFGVGRVARTVPMMDPLRASTQKLLAHCGYRGFSSAEFKKDPRDNSYKLMEINLRPVLQESLFTAAGVNFPYLVFQDLVLNVRTPAPAYLTGLYWHYLAADLVDTLRYAGRREHWNWRDYLNPYQQPGIPLIPFREDPRLFLLKAGISLEKVFAKLLS